MIRDEVILAVSTPPGRSGRGIVRGSGRGVLELIARAVTNPDADPDAGADADPDPDPVADADTVTDAVTDADADTVTDTVTDADPVADADPDADTDAVTDTDADTDATPAPAPAPNPLPTGLHPRRLDLGPVKLPCLLLVFHHPRSYTGEDAVEIHTTGNPHLLERVIDRLLAVAAEAGIAADRAEPGEFTARAFFHGRLTLPQAEGVAAAISARSDGEWRAARLLMSGRLGEQADAIADVLTETLALVEAGIDFTDQDDVVAIAPDALRARLHDIDHALSDLVDRSIPSEQFEARPWVVIDGPPNAGKSTLFNALLGRERAVVSPQPGTTRDVLVEPLAVPGPGGAAEVILVDVAGHEAPGEGLSRQMQDAAAAARARAELVLVCAPADVPSEECADESVASSPASGPPRVQLLTKADLSEEARPGAGVRVSAATGAGLEEVRTLIAERLRPQAISLSADTLILRPRHRAHLGAARQGIADAHRLVAMDADKAALTHPELVASTLRRSLDELGGLVGRFTPDDVLGRIFASFCVGK